MPEAWGGAAVGRWWDGRAAAGRGSSGMSVLRRPLTVCPSRPGSCAGVGGAALFSSSRDFPDDVLIFIKAHPLLDPAVPPATHQPLLTLTSR